MDELMTILSTNFYVALYKMASFNKPLIDFVKYDERHEKIMLKSCLKQYLDEYLQDSEDEKAKINKSILTQFLGNC
jgi:predicted DNA-binding ribbon-helix-helix protein